MSTLPLVVNSVARVAWSARERIEPADIQAMSDLPLTSLVAALSGACGGPGLIRGGLLKAAGGMNCTLEPLFGIDGNNAPGLLLLEEETTVGPFSDNDNGSHFTRIDLVSVRYSQEDASANRTFINDDATTNLENTPIRTTSGILITITEGTPAADPVVPATPAGDIPLAMVTIPWDTADIDDSMIAAVTTHRVGVDPSIFYPRLHYLVTGAANMTLPFTVPLWDLPAIPDSVVGLVSVSFTWKLGSINPGEVVAQVLRPYQPGFTATAYGRQSVPETTKRHEVLFTITGIIPPGTQAGVYNLVLSVLIDGVAAAGLTDSQFEQLSATVSFLPTIAPWPGLST